MTKLEAALKVIQPIHEDAARLAAQRMDRLTKPTGSLGRLEDLAIHLAGISGEPMPSFPRKRVVVMAGDHGVAREGVSAYPPEVTWQMVLNFLAGGAAINVLARRAGAEVVVCDIGVDSNEPRDERLVGKRVVNGTRSMTQGPAMTREEAVQAIEVGIAVAQAGEVDLLATGDMGIGNTTPSSAIAACLLDRPVRELVGRGTGVDDEGLERKVTAIKKALAVNKPNPGEPLDVLAKIGGAEIAGLAGVVIGAAARGVPVLVDGFISTAAALVAGRLCPAARPYMVASHSSVEIGHKAMLDDLGIEPLLNLNLRLGEGTGAAIAMHLVDDACAILSEMATFETAGVSDKE